MTETTRTHPETGAVLRRGVRDMPLSYRDRTITVSVPGWYPDGEGDGILEPADMQILDRALNKLKAEIDHLLSAETVRRIRRKLKLSQRTAGAVLGGGPRAFQKYESGEILVSRPMANLLRLLDEDPSRLAELRKDTAA